ncbi:YybH family protein [Muricoccus radiodurans]|uniref:YybH family protein n=1 Tax=Muricoccus radiodurans TaxID=2231721 RepID=UPI003CEE0252
MDVLQTRTAEDEVRAAVTAFFEAAKRQDITGIADGYAEDVVTYDAIGPVRFVGREAVVAHWQACFAMCQEGSMALRELRVEASGSVAFCSFLLDCGGVGPDGVRHEGTMRGTSCFRREVDGRWRIAHDHCSSPFDPMTGKVLCGPAPA